MTQTTADPVAGIARSADGTTIAYDRFDAPARSAGDGGPPVVMVHAAGGYRDFAPMRSLAEVLAAEIPVVTYDRRGRGLSGDTLPYAVEREVEDLAAVIAAAAGTGGEAFVYANSSGGLLALQAAAAGLPIARMALFEPPIGSDDEDEAADDGAFTRELAALVEAGRRDEAAERFMTEIGVPPEVLAEMAPSLPALAAVAHTLVYDCLLSEATSLATAARVTVPTLILDSEGSTGDLTGWAAAVVGALPDGHHRSLAGEWHGVADADLAAAVTDFFTA